MLAGVGPMARIEQLQCNRDVDVLVAGPGSLRRRLHVQGGDFAVDAAPTPAAKFTTRIARVSAK
jgi:chorismate-pyruvate lyase